MASHFIAAAPTKEFFTPATGGTERSQTGYHTAFLINAETDTAYIEFYVPHDFSSIIEAVVTRLAIDTRTSRLNYASMYFALGEASNANLESLLDQDTVETNSISYEQDISGILSALAAGDYIGIRVLGDGTNIPADGILGVRFKYS